MPFFGKSLQTKYANTISAGAYLGLAQSTMFCDSPLTINSFYHESMSDSDYDCPLSELPITYPNWDSKWYSTHCRPWYKN